jgi:predicted GNAT superfamily acetyltransferase
VGFALKLAQRAMSLDQGIQVVRWTFDPLVARNAHFNLSKLGAHCDRFRRNFYGEMGDSLNLGVAKRPVGGAMGPGPRAGSMAVPRRRIDPVVAGRRLAGSAAARARPRTLDAGARWGADRRAARHAPIRSTDSSLAEAWRDATGEIMAQCFALGLQVVAFDADLQAGIPPMRARAARDLDRLARGRGVTRVRAVELRMIGLPLGAPVPNQLRHLYGEGVRLGARRDR